jgi:hypothetical protein
MIGKANVGLQGKPMPLLQKQQSGIINIIQSMEKGDEG